MAAEDWIIARLHQRIDWADSLATFVLDGEVPDFLPGQFLRVGMDLGEAEPTSRPYSLASAPGAPLELFVVRVEGGALTPSLFEAPLGAPIFVHRRAAGVFTLEGVPSASELWLIGTGTGLAPYISMLRDGGLFSRFERVILVQSVRYPTQLAYADEIAAEVAARGGRLTHLRLVSQGAAPGALRGRVTTALHDGSLEAAAGSALVPERAQVLLCGNPDMVIEMQSLLGERGMSRNRRRAPGHVTAEKFW